MISNKLQVRTRSWFHLSFLLSYEGFPPSYVTPLQCCWWSHPYLLSPFVFDIPLPPANHPPPPMSTFSHPSLLPLHLACDMLAVKRRRAALPLIALRPGTSCVCFPSLWYHARWHGAGRTADLRTEWEAGAFQLERLQAAPECVQAEQSVQAQRQAPTWTLPYTPTPTPDEKLQVSFCCF